MTDADKTEYNITPPAAQDNSENLSFLKPDAPKFGTKVPPAPQASAPSSPVRQPAGAPTQRADGLGIASMVLGIVSIVCCWSPFFGLLLAILGLIFGLCAKRINGKKSGFAIAGIITSAIGILLGTVYLLFILYHGEFSISLPFSDYDNPYQFEL